MKDQQDHEIDYEIQYFILDDGSVARIWTECNGDDEYLEGEFLNKWGKWKDCFVDEILAAGNEIEFDDAVELVRDQGGLIFPDTDIDDAF
jgi:hypothetical protein